MKKYVLLIVLLCASCSSTKESCEKTSVVGKVLSPCVKIMVRSSQAGLNGAQGTGVCVLARESDEGNTYVFLTARHVARAVQKYCGKSLRMDKGEIEYHVFGFVYDENWRIQGIEVLRPIATVTEMSVIESEFHDMSFLIVRTSEKIEVKECELAPEGYELEIGERIYGAVIAASRAPMFKSGRVSQFTMDDEVILDAGMWRGSSGAAIYNKEGQMVALVYAAYDSTSVICIPVEQVYHFMEQTAVMLEGE